MVTVGSAERREYAAGATVDDIRAWLDRVPDPEIPVLSVNDLGIVREIAINGGNVLVSVAPTYTGCPATEVIEGMIAGELRRRGIANVEIRRVLSPPWTSDWLSDSGRRKLRAFGIAPPIEGAGMRDTHRLARQLKGRGDVLCPRCASGDTVLVSEFGSTPCKAAFKCNDCLEPFDYFKCL